MKYVWTIDVTKTDSASECEPQTLYDEIWTCLEQTTRYYLTDPAYGLVLTEYLGMTAKDGQFYPNASHSNASPIHFVFSDGAGRCSMSAVACRHWFRLSRWVISDLLDAKAESIGWKLEEATERPSPLDSGSEYPLIILDGNPYAVAIDDGEVTEIFTDEMPDPLTLDSLSDDQRRRVSAIADDGECQCRICRKIREGVPTPDAGDLQRVRSLL